MATKTKGTKEGESAELRQGGEDSNFLYNTDIAIGVI